MQKISIISRGRAGGYTLKLPAEDRHFYPRKYFIDELAVLLGGYTAEQYHFKEITTGASDDLKKAADLARRLVTQYGMSKKFGPIVFDTREETVFLGREFVEQRNVSETVASKIDSEVSSLIKTALKTAQSIVRKRTAVLEKIANRLIEKETIERQEFERLVAEPAGAKA